MSKDNQHYIPQGYLRKFSIEGEKSLIWEYDKIINKISKNPKSIRNICCEFQYYAQEYLDGNLEKDGIENAFSKYVEDPGIRAIDAIPENANTLFTLDGHQKGFLAFFISILATRGPSFRDGIKDLHEQIVKKVGRPIISESIKANQCPEILMEEFKSKDIWDVIKVEIKDWISLEPMIEMAKVGAEVLLQKKWKFFCVENESTFVTSDNPFIFLSPFKSNSPYQIEPFNPMATVIVPLRKNLVFMATEPASQVQSEFLLKRASKNQIIKINDDLIKAALRYIYSPIKSKKILNKVIKFRGYTQKLQVV